MTKLKRNIIANFAGRAWTNILAILFIPLYLKFIGIEAYGLVGFFVTLQTLLGIMDLGMGAVLNREMARLSTSQDNAGEQRDLLRTLEIIYWIIACVGGLIVIILAPFIAQSWINAKNIPEETITSAIRLMGTVIILQFPFSFYQGGLLGLQKQVLLNIILVVVGTLRSVGAVLVLWLVSPTIQAFLVWQFLMSALGTGSCIYYLWQSLPMSHNQPKFRKALLPGVWKYAAAMSANGIIGVVLTQLDKVILSKMLTLEMFGYYTIAGSVAAALWTIIGPYNTALFPRFVQLFESRNFPELNTLFHRASQVLSVVLLPIAMILVLFSKEILLIWTRNNAVAENAHVIVSLLVIGTAVNGIASVPTGAITAFGWPQIITYTNLLQAVILVPAIIVMVDLYGTVGAAIVWVVLNCAYVFIMVPIMFRRYLISAKRDWFVYDTGIPFVISVLFCLFSYCVMPKGFSYAAIFLWLAATWLLSSTGVVFSCSYPREKIFYFLEKNAVLR